MIRKWRNQKEIPFPKTKIGKTNRQTGTNAKAISKLSEQLFPKRWSFSYLKLTHKKYKKVHKLQTPQAFNTKQHKNYKNDNRSIALERSVI